MEPKLLESLLRSHGAALQLFASQWCSNAEDCVQKAFIKLALTESDPAAPIPWLFRVVKNEAISASRSESRRRIREQSYGQQRFEVTDQCRFEPDELENAIERLDDDVREIVVAKIWGGLSFEEIGSLTQTSSTSAHRKYHGALSELRRILRFEKLVSE